MADQERSGARIVAAGDEERRRLEQDLHDGAQQRLVALVLELQVFRSLHPDADGPGLAEAERELRAAVEELRALARGVYPALLRTAGLAGGLQGLAETRPVRIAGVPVERLPDVVESTVFLLAERLSATGWTTLRVDRCDGHVAVQAEVAGARPGLGDLVARITTLDGTVTTTADGEGSRVQVRLPLPGPS
ncbi:histidine kinase [Blastococcus sp. SYSU D00669]